MMSRILGLDLGTKRIGVAISDPSEVVAQALSPIERGQGDGWAQEIEILVAEYQVAEVVVGLPRNMNGSEGPAAAEARKMAALLTERLSVPITLRDERLTTVAAQRLFREAGVKTHRARKHLDGVAAALILQGYLDQRAGREGKP
jgi:putative Holliday junction resolvase